MNKFKKEVLISVNKINLEGNLVIPDNAIGIVLFSHGAGSSRFSPRNNYVARVLEDANIGTLLFDLLTEKEDEIFENRFNIDLLTNRLLAAVNWIKNLKETQNLNIGLFGASTGASSALKVAAVLGKEIKAVVSRGGRPDLVMEILDRIVSPTLLIVGGDDEPIINLNALAYEKIRAEKKLEIIPGATHLFEEPGALEKVAELAKNWFKNYLKNIN